MEEVDPIYEAIKCAASLSSVPCIDSSPRPSLVPSIMAPSGSPLSGSYSSGSANSLAPDGIDPVMSKSAPHRYHSLVLYFMVYRELSISI